MTIYLDFITGLQHLLQLQELVLCDCNALRDISHILRPYASSSTIDISGVMREVASKAEVKHMSLHTIDLQSCRKLAPEITDALQVSHPGIEVKNANWRQVERQHLQLGSRRPGSRASHHNNRMEIRRLAFPTTTAKLSGFPHIKLDHIPRRIVSSGNGWGPGSSNQTSPSSWYLSRNMAT
jgi:hypothetical protein